LMESVHLIHQIQRKTNLPLKKEQEVKRDKCQQIQ
jgi:hypothetical protein